MNKTYILGAGFSRAVSLHMPLLSELSAAVLSGMRGGLFPDEVPGELSFGHDLEAWMSFLHTPQPWLSVSENLLNRAAFVELTGQIAAVIEDTQAKATATCPPAWLLCLVARWVEEGATVITFNYDDLVERSARDFLRATSVNQSTTNFYPVPLPLASARSSGGAMWGDGGGPVVFPVLKLHGSASWYYSGLDAPHGDTVYRSKYGDYWDTPLSQADSSVADKIPFIIPPTAVKNEFYSNDFLSSQWRLAADAIAGADEVHVLGYSAPASDLLVRAFIGTNLRATSLWWVNPDDSGVTRLSDFARSLPPVAKSPGLAEYVGSRGPVLWSCGRVDAPHAPNTFDGSRAYEAHARALLRRDRCPICEVQLAVDAHHTGATDSSCPCCFSKWENTDPPAFAPGRLTASAS